MTTLVIHPDDRSTDFLRPIYSGVDTKTVLTDAVSEEQLIEAIGSHDQIIMLGHGSPYGLFNVAQMGHGGTTIGERHVSLLRNKPGIYIWCNADRFVERHGLRGLYTGMFVSEVGESAACGVSSPQQTVDESNQLFARVLGEALINRMPYSEAYEYVDTKYGMLADLNDVARYNLERWYCRMDERMDHRTGKLGSHTWPGRQLELALLGSRELSSYI